MREALALLAKSGEQFRFYEKQHRAKGTPDADAKAEVNRELAEEIEKCLASQPLETLTAQIAHQANKAWCSYIGDDSQLDWPVAPNWAKTSACDGVRFHRDNPDAGDEASHENWLALKLEEGWVYGREKNPDLKTHPCMVPFRDLSPEQQFKDRLFRTVVHAAFHL